MASIGPIDLLDFSLMALQTVTNLRDEIYARSNLTRRQLLVWEAQERRPVSTAYNLPFQFDISGRLDPGRFDAAFDLLVQKTDAPRTIFQEIDGVPRQVWLDHVPRKNIFRNLVSERHPEAAALAIAHDLISRPFPLDQPLYRSILLQLAPEKFRWLVSQHHLIADGYSRMIWFERMSRLYLGEDSDDSPGYADYIRQERSLNPGPAQKAYWRQRAFGINARNTCYGIAPVESKLHTRSRPVVLSAETSRQILTLAASPEIVRRNPDTSIANVFMAVTAALLSRVGGKREFTLAMPVHNRRPELRRSPGLFTETYPIQFYFSTPQTVAGLIHSAADQAIANHRHGPLPENVGGLPG